MLAYFSLQLALADQCFSTSAVQAAASRAATTNTILKLLMCVPAFYPDAIYAVFACRPRSFYKAQILDFKWKVY